jgi:uncharacterized protein (TIGR03435 family)
MHKTKTMTLAKNLPFVAALALYLINASSVRAQLGPATEFEVASIKPCDTGTAGPRGRSGGLQTTPGKLTVTCLSVRFLIQVAYAPSPDASVPISGGPAWIDSDPYDIEAKAENNPSREAMTGPMLQALLASRFQLSIRRESKEVPVYDLTVAKGGSKLRAFQEGSCVPNDPERPPVTTPGQKRPIICGSFSMGRRGDNFTLDVHRRSVAEFSRQLHLDRPVIDKTGLRGLFDFHLEFRVDGTTAGFFPPGFPMPAPSDDPDGLSIFTAVQQQLGLRLEPSKGASEFLVIDHVERPSEN